MPQQAHGRSVAWTGRGLQFEALEARLVLSGHPLGDFQVDYLFEDAAGATGPQKLADVHAQTGLAEVRQKYGFAGAGQTVAVIDSGIAWDHMALGEGFGPGYRVVGGWDFSENDADPYDDGPLGSHGTHVAGIIGADAGLNSGVAPGVNLVALRVFDDQGVGYFDWVEQALQWVHENRNALDNPITTVNISLGTTTNSDTPPAWGVFEDELSQLEADGIFIAVAAGNAYQQFAAAGLDYPASSPHVVPVMSVDPSGSLSNFSQRDDRAIAAPGRSITSTVPDYVGNQNGRQDDFASYSGTSMAAPYVAGVSVLVREAMEFVGYQNITQDTIYDYLRNTADVIYDSATDANYYRIDVLAAFDALMPDDDYGSTVNTAYALGTLSGERSLSGLISQLDDVDFFTFTAAATGTARFSVAATTPELAPNSGLVGGGGTLEDNTLSFAVSAGQSYSVFLQTDAGIGFYDATFALQASLIDLGAIDFQQLLDESLSGSETWYQLTATRNGTLTVEAFFDHAAGNVNLELYDARNQLLASSTSTSDSERVDVDAATGQSFLLKVVGGNADVDLRLTNLLAVFNGQADLHGTAGDDVFTVVTGAQHQLTVNGVSYTLNGSNVSLININGHRGQDELAVTGSDLQDTATLQVGSVSLVSADYEVNAVNVETNRIYGGAGNNIARFYDSAGDDRFYGYADTLEAVLTGEGFYNYTRGFESTYAFANAGGQNDRADFYDSQGDDRYIARAYKRDAYMYGDGFYNYSRGFESTYAYATAGGENDRADFYDSQGDDHYITRAYQNDASMSGPGFYNFARGFDTTYAFAIAGGQNDRADFYDSQGDDQYTARAGMNDAYMSGTGFYNYTRGFESTYAFAIEGGQNDQADFYDSQGDDRYIARAYKRDAYMYGDGFYNYSRGFDTTYAYATAGGENDRADFYDSQGDDHYITRAYRNDAFMSGPGFYNYARGFDTTYAFAIAGGANDRADFYDSQGDDQYTARAGMNDAFMSGDGFYNYTRGFESTYAFASEGGQNDRADFYDSQGDDRYIARAYKHDAYMYGDGFYNYSRGFESTYAYATAGGENDRADFYDSQGDDHYTVRAYQNDAFMSGDGFYNYARGFDTTYAFAIAGGANDRADFYDSQGDDQYTARAGMNDAFMSGAGFYNYTRGFESTYAVANSGGKNDRADFVGVAAGTRLTATVNTARAESAKNSMAAVGFKTVRATAERNASPAAELAALDYVLELVGDWSIDLI